MAGRSKKTSALIPTPLAIRRYQETDRLLPPPVRLPVVTVPSEAIVLVFFNGFAGLTADVSNDVLIHGTSCL
jgi:hypothetical protein